MKFLRFSLTRIVLGAILILFSYVILSNYLPSLAFQLGLPEQASVCIFSILTVILLPLIYKWFFGWIEKRTVTEVSFDRFGRNLLWGLLLGVVLQSFVIMFIYAMGGYTVTGVNSASVMLMPFLFAMITGVFEEVLFRGVVFRIVEERLGSWIALIISALIFGFLHLANQNSEFTDGLAVAIEAGLLLGACYILTRNLWMPIIFHAAWNFTQGTIYGAAVSGGSDGNSLIMAKIEGAKWFTGGGFGPEGSVQAVVFCSIATVVILILCAKKGLFVKGALWLKKEEGHAQNANQGA